MSALKDLTGQRFGRLVVIDRAGSDYQKRATWKCCCDCGCKIVVPSSRLTNGETKSCGCFRRELARDKRTFRHGKSQTRLYRVWSSAIQRCEYPKHKQFHQYGGRGITICDEWRDNFQAFYDWAMANGYDENAPRGQCTIDRIDNDKGYSPDNCRWVDMKTQGNNRSHSGPLPKNQRS